MTDETEASRSDFGMANSASLRPAAPRKPACKLIGTDGNVFSIIGRVRRALDQNRQPDRAREFVKQAFESKSYDEVLRLCLEYVEVD